MAIETEKDRRAREAIEALTQQLAEVRDECDGLARDLEAERSHRRAIEKSEQALAAHVERLRLVAENMDYFNDSIDLGDAEIAASDAGDTLDEILARRDALMKAEAWDECAQGLGGMDQELAEIRAGKYRDQSREVS